MEFPKGAKVSDIVTTLVGAFVLGALAWSIAQGTVGGWDWKIHGIWAGVGLVLVLPFRQVMELLSELPWTDGESDG